MKKNMTIFLENLFFIPCNFEKRKFDETY